MATSELYDGFLNQSEGMNGGLCPGDLSVGQYYKGINITCRRGEVSTRPPFLEVSLEWLYGHDETNFQRRKFQGAYVFTGGNRTVIACGMAGKVYLIDPLDGSTWNITDQVGRRFSQYVDRLFFCQAETDLIVQDGTNKAMIISLSFVGRDAVTIAPDYEVPTGTVMAYGHGRLFVKTSPYEFIAGDINLPTDPTNRLKFTENLYFNGGGAFSLPARLGEIKSMIFSNADSGTGSGPLYVLCDNGVATYMVNITRATNNTLGIAGWNDADIGRIQLVSIGATGPYAAVQSNQDVMFRDKNGLRSYALARYDILKKHRFTGLSQEMDPILEQETPWLLPLVSMCTHGDRLFFTTVAEKVIVPDQSGQDIEDWRFKGIVSMDFAPVNTMSKQDVGAAFDSVWTGPHPVFIVSGVFGNEEEMYVFGRDNGGYMHLYKLGKRLGKDNGVTPINCRWFSRGMPFKALTAKGVSVVPYRQKKLDKWNVWIHYVEGTVELAAGMTSDQHPVWSYMSGGMLEAPVTFVAAEAEETIEVGCPQSRSRRSFPLARTACNDATGRDLLRGYEFQFMLEWSGIMKFRKMGMIATDEPETSMPLCDEEAVNLVCCPTCRDDFNYDLNGGVPLWTG